MAIDIKSTIDELPVRTKEELNRLENQIRLNNKARKDFIKWLPRQLRSEQSDKILMNIDFLDPNFSTALTQVPEKNRSEYVYNAALLKESYGEELSCAEALQRIAQWKKEPDIFLETLIWNNDVYFVLDSMFKAIDSWIDPFNATVIPSNVIFTNNNIVNCFEYIDDENRVLKFENLPQDVQDTLLSWLESKYKELLKDSISNSLKIYPNISPVSLFNNEEVFDLYVKYYNVQHYGESPINNKLLTNRDRQKLQKYFNAELYNLWYNVDADEETLKELEERNKRIREENQKRMEEFKKRNGRINGRFRWNKHKSNPNLQQIESIDIHNASWVNIAQSLWLWKQLSQKYISIEDNLNNWENNQLNKMSFSIARSKFIESHSNLKSYITINIMKNLYDANSNTIKNIDDKAWDKLKDIFKDQPEEIEQVYTQLLIFPFEVSSTKEDLQKNNKYLNSMENENENNKAIGAVIDNVRDIFAWISHNLEWDIPTKLFKFRDFESIKLIWDDLIMYWTFNWSNVTLRYNLWSWDLFMNSFLQHNGYNKITIWDTNIANYKIWQLETFNNILNYSKDKQQKLENNDESHNHNSYHDFQTKSDKNNVFHSLSTQINLIENAIIAWTEKQSERNSVISNFMKTFNIIQDGQEEKSIDFNDWSNFFDFLQIVENSEPEVLGKFQIFMKKVMEYSWLKWWSNNILGSQKNEKTDITFDENNKNKYISLVRDCTKTFSKNPTIFKGKVNFESDSQLGFIKMIIENITNDVSKPNWKLNTTKMKDFLYHLENDDKKS